MLLSMQFFFLSISIFLFPLVFGPFPSNIEHGFGYSARLESCQGIFIFLQFEFLNAESLVRKIPANIHTQHFCYYTLKAHGYPLEDFKFCLFAKMGWPLLTNYSSHF